MPAYSPFIQLIYDQLEPVGLLGRGTHYSILRAVSWQNAGLKPVNLSTLHNFAVIWDEDHDERVITVIERIYRHGLLAPVLFVGERKGVLSVIVSKHAHEQMGAASLEPYRSRLQPLAQPDVDSWSVETSVFGDKASSIIDDNQNDVGLYLRSIDLLWKLGHRVPSSNAA